MSRSYERPNLFSFATPSQSVGESVFSRRGNREIRSSGNRKKSRATQCRTKRQPGTLFHRKNSNEGIPSRTSRRKNRRHRRHVGQEGWRTSRSVVLYGLTAEGYPNRGRNAPLRSRKRRGEQPRRRRRRRRFTPFFKDGFPFGVAVVTNGQELSMERKGENPIPSKRPRRNGRNPEKRNGPSDVRATSKSRGSGTIFRRLRRRRARRFGNYRRIIEVCPRCPSCLPASLLGKDLIFGAYSAKSRSRSRSSTDRIWPSEG